MKLLVLLGHTNNSNGELSRVAINRCKMAIDFLGKDPSLMVLPTGMFGSHFNMTSTPHGVYLTNYLIDNGIAQDRVLKPTSSSNTLEDAYCVRRIAVDRDFDEIIVITSDFHMERVRYIFYRIFPEFSLKFASASTEPMDRDYLQKKEVCSFNKLRKQWVDAPLYKKDRKFVTEIYNNASVEHKHFDTVSLSVMTGYVVLLSLVISSYYGLFVKGYPETNQTTMWLACFFLLLCIIAFNLLFLVYQRAAQTAWHARKVMERIEISFGMPGFSATYNSGAANARNFGTFLLNTRLMRDGLSIRLVMTFFGIMVTFSLLFLLGLEVWSLASVYLRTPG